MTDPVSPHTMLPAKEAGHLVGYTADYVSKLAREGKIVGKKIGKMWFVDEASLRKFSRGIASVEKQRLEALRKSRVTEYKNGHERRLPKQKHFHPRAGTTPIVRAFLRQFAGASVAALVFAISFFAGYSYVRIAPLQKAAALFASVEHGGQKARATPVPVFEATDTFARFAARQGERAVDTTVSALQDSFHVPYAESPVGYFVTPHHAPKITFGDLHTALLDAPVIIYAASDALVHAYVDFLFSWPARSSALVDISAERAVSFVSSALHAHARLSETLASLWLDRALIAEELAADRSAAFSRTAFLYSAFGDGFVDVTNRALLAYKDTVFPQPVVVLSHAARVAHDAAAGARGAVSVSVRGVVPQIEASLFRLPLSAASAVEEIRRTSLALAADAYNVLFGSGARTTLHPSGVTANIFDAVASTSASWARDFFGGVAKLFRPLAESPRVIAEPLEDLIKPVVKAPAQTGGGETVVQNYNDYVTLSGVSQATLTEQLEVLKNGLLSELYTFTASAERGIAGNNRAIQGTNRINQLANIAISGSTFTGGSISDASSISATSISGTFSGSISGGTGSFSTLGAATTTLSGPLAVSSTATSTIAGQARFSFVPTEAHTFGAWAIGTASSSAANASLYINPASAAADSNLFAAAVNGVVKFLLDAEGDIYANSLTASGGVTLATTSASTFSVEGNTTLGDAIGDTLTVNARLASDLIPQTANTYDLGTTTLGFRSGFFNSSLLVGNTATTTIRGDQATSTFSSGVDAARLNTSATSTLGGLQIPTGGLSIGSLSGILKATSGVVSAAVAGADYLTNAFQNWNLTTTTFGQSALAPTTTQNIAVSGVGTSTFAGGLEAWRQIASPYFNATSTTATSTFAGGLVAGLSNAFNVLQNGRVGIGTAAPTTGLDIDVATDISGNLTLSGGGALTISATGPINQTGTGQVTFAGNVNATNGLDVTTANLTVGGANFSVAPATGNITGTGSLSLAGALNASSTLQSTGAARFYSTLLTDGTLTAAGAGTGLSVTNNATVGGTFNTTGAGTFGSTLAVSGAVSAPSLSLTSGVLSLNTQKITGLASPTVDSDAANKSYVDSVAQGLDLKASTRAATTANITLSGEQTVDGVSLIAGDRVFVKNQADKTKNGIYVAATGAWTRSTDADSDAEVNPGMFAFVSEGTTNANSGWVLTTAEPITLGTTLLDFTQFSGAGQIIAGDGLTKSGNTLTVVGTANRITASADSIDIASTYVGQTSLTTVGTLTAGALGSGFGAINIGTSPITAGAASFSSIVGSAITGSGNLTVNGTGSFTGNVTVSGTLTAATTTFSGDVALGGKKITGLADPTSAQEAATKGYVDAIAQGLTVKASVRAATTANITLSGTQTVDGVLLIAGNRILVKNQTTASENGIYTVAAGAWSRSTDADENSEVVQGLFTFVTEGTTQANTGWSLITANPITLGTTALTFTQFSGSAEITAGNGLTKTGNTLDVVGTADRISVTADAIDIASTYVGQTSLTTVGTLTAGALGSGFGAINIGASAITGGAGTFSSLANFGTLSVGGTATTTIQGNSATSTFSGGISLLGGNINLATGGNFLINNAPALSATTLGAGVVNSSLTSVGVLDSGQITTGFGAINIGADSLQAGVGTLSTLTLSGALTVSNSPSCTGSNALQTDGSGNVACGAISPISGASSAGGWTTNSIGSVTLATTTDRVGIGATTTPYAKLSILSGATATTTLALVPVSAQTANILDIYNTSGALASVFTAGGRLGLGTTSPGSLLSLGNTGADTINISPTATSTFGNGLSASRLNASATSTFAGVQISSGGLSIGSLSGFLKTTTGAVATSLINLAADITGTLPIGSGGTATTTFYNGGIAFYNSTLGTLSQASAQSGLFYDNANSRLGLGTTTPFAKLTVIGPDTLTSPTLSLRQSNDTSFGFDFDIESASVGRLDLYRVVADTRTQVLSILRGSGNLGLGTTSPGTLFALGNTGNDTINISPTATSTFGSGINIRTGCFAVNGTCVGAGASTYLGLTDTPSSFTANRIPFTNSGATALTDSANFTFNGSLLTVTGNASTTQLGSTGSSYFATAGGNVGIATTSPWGMLSVNPNGISGPSFVIGSSTATSLIVTNGGNVGIGLTSPALSTPSGTLDAAGAVIARGQINAHQTSAAVLEDGGGTGAHIRAYGATAGSGVIVFRAGGGGGSTDTEYARITGAGLVGIGTTSPGYPLTVRGTGVSSIPVASFEQPSGGGIGGVRFLSNNGGGNYGSWLQFTDIGTDSASIRTVASGGLRFATAGTERITIDGSGNVGIGQASPGSLLHVGGTTLSTRNLQVDSNGLIISRFDDNSLHNNLILQNRGISAVGNGVGINFVIDSGGGAGTQAANISAVSENTTFSGATADGNLVFAVTLNGASSEAARLTSTTLSIDEGAGKITVGTIDPVYTIGGTAYATYVAGMIGQKEEITGVANIDTATKDSEGNTGYTHIIDFDEQETASDLWLFGQATQLNKNIDKLVALLTPEGNAKVWYQIDKAENRITLLSNVPTKVSYRFTAPRFDFETWTNFNHDGVTGFEPPATDERFFSDSAPAFSFGTAEFGFDISALFDDLKEYIIAWLADNMNNIGEVFARAVNARERICVDGECLTADDVRALKSLALSSSALTAAGADAENVRRPTSDIDTTAPVITLFGNNPAEIAIGDSYADLGASVSDDTDQNLGIHTFINDVEVTSVSLDTSTSTTYTITYRATDQAANTGEATRTVIVGTGGRPTSASSTSSEAESSTSDVAQAEEPTLEPEPVNEEPSAEEPVQESEPVQEEPTPAPAPEPAPQEKPATTTPSFL